jgi:hypothetical protein
MEGGTVKDSPRYRFKFSILGKYQSTLRGNAPHVTVNMSGGPDGHFVLCGTLTMTEDEWEAFVEALDRGLHGGVEIEDLTAVPSPAD